MLVMMVPWDFLPLDGALGCVCKTCVKQMWVIFLGKEWTSLSQFPGSRKFPSVLPERQVFHFFSFHLHLCLHIYSLDWFYLPTCIHVKVLRGAKLKSQLVNINKSNQIFPCESKFSRPWTKTWSTSPLLLSPRRKWKAKEGSKGLTSQTVKRFSAYWSVDQNDALWLFCQLRMITQRCNPGAARAVVLRRLEHSAQRNTEFPT